MLITVRPLLEMLLLRVRLTAFSAMGSRSDIGPIPSAGAGQLSLSPWMMLFSSVRTDSEVPGGRREIVPGGVPGGMRLPCDDLRTV